MRRIIALLLLFFALSSCSDSGCIDADDFGEYESQTIQVASNAAESQCVYDTTKEITDASQGSGLKPCFISGTVSVSDENNAPIPAETINTGCSGFGTSANQMKGKSLCIAQCVQSCFSNAGGSTTSAEPNWTSTDAKISGKNQGVTIAPNSKIVIKAVGSVSLGDKVSYPDIFVNAVSPMPHSQNASWNDIFYDVTPGRTVNIKFTGQFTDAIDSGNIAAQPVGAGASALSAQWYNGARRLVGFLIPHPVGYDFDNTQITEAAGAKNVPLLPDPNAWTCSYSGTDENQSSCSNKANGYFGIGYTNVSDTLINSVFPISSSAFASGVGTYGGMIRYTNDGLKDDAYDPFALSPAPTCAANGNCTNINAVSTAEGQILGNASGSGAVIQYSSIPNSGGNGFKVSFKSLLSSETTCNVALNVSIQDSAGHILYTINPTITSSSWSGNAALDQGQKIVVTTVATTSAGTNCGQVIAVRYTKYYDLKINQSGLVRFMMLNGMVGGASNCTVKARIINKDNGDPSLNYSPTTGATFTGDFYEYDNFSTASSVDPLANLTVSPTPSTSNAVLSNPAFVRKGQYIRFSPESWNGTWSTGSGARKCGIGMAITIKPRPALLCKGQAASYVQNTSSECRLKYNSSGNLIGCDAYSSTCSDPNSTSDYCPQEACIPTISCTGEGTTPDYTRSGCTSAPPSTSCTIAAGSGYTQTKCNSCAESRRLHAMLPAKIQQNGLDICYDLERYSGKVSNIPVGGFLDADWTRTSFSSALPNVRKGAAILSPFNGVYGNFEGFADDNSTDSVNSNHVLKLSSPVTFTSPGRIRFFVLDGSSFQAVEGADASYSINTTFGSSYSGVNGFKISTSGALEFNNGQWLEARLCEEATDSGTACRSLTLAPASGGAGEVNETVYSPSTIQYPNLISVNDPSGSAPVGSLPTINTNSRYAFDNYGNLIRTDATIVDPRDCTAATNGIQTSAGVNFYCHRGTQTPGNLRLTFKIKDPDTATCTIPTLNLSAPNTPTACSGAACNGIKMTNPFYDSSTAGMAGAICNYGEPLVATTGGPNPCKKQYYCASKYANNSGSYTVKVKVDTKAGCNAVTGVACSSNASSIIGNVIKPVVEIMDGKKDNPNTANVDESTMGQAERMYKLIILDPRYQFILKLSLVLMYTFYGLTFSMGLSELSYSELINRVIKIGLIYLFVGEQGWDWFNNIVVHFFKNGTDYIAFMMASAFDQSPELAQAIANQDYYDKSILFSSVDNVFGIFFSDVVQKKLIALLFASLFGFVYLMIIFSSFMMYVYAVANAVLLYLTAQVFTSILFTLGPIFFVFTLFGQTKDMFENWLKQLIGFSLQQIFLLTTLAFFNMMMYEVVKMSLGYKICWDDIWTINIITRITLLSGWTIASLPPRTNSQSEVGNIGNPEGIPSLFTILYIWVIASLMEVFIGFMTDLASSIGGGMKLTGLADGIKKFAGGLHGSMSKMLDKAWDASAGQMIKKADQFLFDSGELAHKDREKRKAEIAENLRTKGAAGKASDDAISKYKQENGAKLAGMSKDDQNKTLRDIGDKAMKSKFKELGLDYDTADGKKKIDALMNQKGVQSTATNLMSWMKDAVEQSGRRGGTTGTSLSDQLNKRDQTTFSSKEAQQAVAKAKTKEDRDKIISAAKDGKIEIKSGARKSIDETKSAIKDAYKESVFAKVLSKDYTKARQELESEGKISRMARSDKLGIGTGFARSDAETRMVRDRMRQNIEKRKQLKSTKQTASVDEVSALEAKSKSIEQDEKDKKEYGDAKGFKETSKVVARQSAQSAMRGLDKIFSGVANLGHYNRKTNAIKKTGAQKEIRDKLKAKVGVDLTAAKDQKQTYEADFDKEMKEIDAINGDSDFQKFNSELSTKQGHLDSGTDGSGAKLDRTARRKLQSEIAAIKQNPEYNSFLNRKQAANANAIAAQNQAREADNQVKKLQQFETNIQDAEAIYDAAVTAYELETGRVGLVESLIPGNGKRIKDAFGSDAEDAVAGSSWGKNGYHELETPEDFQKYVNDFKPIFKP